LEVLNYQQAFEKCRDHRLNIINDRFLTVPEKIMGLDQIFDEYCDDLKQIRKQEEEKKRKKKERGGTQEEWNS